MLSGQIHDIRTIFDQNSDLVRGVTQLPETKYKFLELETKFGYYSEKGFNSNVPYFHYERLLNSLRTFPQVGPEITEESHVEQMGNIRHIIITPIGDGPEIVLWQKKTRLRNFEFPDYDIRISANIEESLNAKEIPEPFNATIIRDRTRHTFSMANDLIKVDMTEVIMRDEGKVIRPQYEVEIEFLGNKNDLPVFEQYIGVIFKLLRGTNLIYTNTVKNQLIRDTIKIVGSTRTDMIDKDILVEARNIKRRDLIYGGIVGNRFIINDIILSKPRRKERSSPRDKGTGYMITFKADGLRKLLIIHNSGIWLVYPPFEFNLVLDLSLKVPQLDKLLTGFNGTIFDGELVVPKQPRRLLYWYLAFDCIAFRGNAAIQLQPYTERQKIVNAIAGAMKTPVLTIDTKETKEIQTPQDFFILVREFLDKRDTLEYNEDGLIFVPIDTIYNPHSQDYPLRDRSLTRIPDVCKWKEARDITIDFALKWIEGGRLDLYVYNDETGKTEPFRGDNINPLTPDMIDYQNELTLNKPTGLVVEYEWTKLPQTEVAEVTQGFLRPRRIRYDKFGPNRLSIALDDWEDIMNPITEEDIKGESLMMTFSYHNRIKKSLYEILTLNPDYKPQIKGIKKYRGINILDIGSGMGGDTAKWIKLADKDDPTTGFVVAVEPNANNRQELINRIKTFNIQDKVNIIPTGGEDTVAITDAVRKFIPGGKVDAVTLMLSMSFFWASDSHLDALVKTIVTNLKPGGQIVFLTIDGTVIEQIFEPALGGPNITDKTIATANIHLYPKLQLPFGRPVDFILPNTIVGEQREYIVHLQDFTSRLGLYGIHLYELHRAESEKLLSEENSLFSSMYSFGYYVNDDKIALLEYEQTAHSPVNIILPVIPSPRKYPTIQMYQPTATIIPTISVTGIPRLPTPEVTPTPPISKRPTQPVRPTQLITPPIPKLPTQPIIPLAPQVLVQPTITIPLLTQSQTGAVVTKPTKYEIEQNQLRWLSVSYTGMGGRIVTGPARNDDTYAPLTCTWYDNLVRIATIGEGSCFIHAVLKAFYKPYQENNSARYRLDTAAKLRRDLAIILGLENPQYPGYTYWDTTARGSFPRMVMEEIADEDLIGLLRVDYSLSGLQRLLNSTSQLGEEVYKFISDALNIDIYVLRATRDDLYPNSHTHHPNIPRNGVVIIGNTYHYEVLAVDGEFGFQTVFPPDDPFLKALTEIFIGDGDFNDIVNVIPYDPDTAFVQNAVNAFVTKTGLNIPAKINEIFLENDPFLLTLNRLMPHIKEMAQIRIAQLNEPEPPPENPVLDHLDRILRILRDSGYTDEETNQIREIVEHRLIPDIPQSLDAIIASAETDGLLSQDQVQAIRNSEITLEI